MSVETPRQFAERMRKKLEELQKNNRPFQIAVTSSAAEVAKRAFSDGKNNVGESFNYNSTNPLYISDEQSPRDLSRKGKTGRDTFESGKNKGDKHKTTYFDSYKKFRATVGRRDSYVNWQLTGDLMSDFGSLPPPTSKNPPDLGQMKPAVKINVNEYITKLDRPNNVEKYNGLADRFGDFLKTSKEEEKRFFEILDKELANFLSL